jgi:hypothetical protein
MRYEQDQASFSSLLTAHYLFQRRHINHKSVPNIALQHTFVSVIDSLNRHDLDIASDFMLRTKIEHLLRLGNPSDL